MTSLNIIRTGCLGLASLFVLQSCDKDLEQKLPEQSDFTNYSTIQVFNAMVGSNRTYVYVDGKAVSGATVAYGSSFPSSATGFAIPSGLRAFVVKDTLVNSPQLQLSFAENFQSNKWYTVFVYDTITSPKQITVPTTIEIPSDTTARVRFANFAYSTAALPPVDIYSLKRKANVFSNVTKTDVTNFTAYASALSDTLLVRAAGTTTLLAQLNGFNPVQKRSYTLVFRGGVTKSLSAFSNY